MLPLDSRAFARALSQKLHICCSHYFTLNRSLLVGRFKLMGTLSIHATDETSLKADKECSLLLLLLDAEDVCEHVMKAHARASFGQMETHAPVPAKALDNLTHGQGQGQPEHVIGPSTCACTTQWQGNGF